MGIGKIVPINSDHHLFNVPQRSYHPIYQIGEKVIKSPVKVTDLTVKNRFLENNKVSSPGYRIYSLKSENHISKILSLNITSRAHVLSRSILTTDIYILPSLSNLCPDAKKSLSIDNAGGKSEISEMFSIDYFSHIYNAYDTIFETEVNYWFSYKMIDFICTINNERVGVSVARAMGYPTPNYFTPDIARKLLHKKLYGLIVARNGVIKSQSFTKSILHIWCQDLRIAYLLEEAYCNINPIDYGINVKGVVIIQLTVCDDPQLYKNILF